MPKKNIFRKSSLERLSSPEQLDQLMQVTTPKSWIALCSLCGLLVLTVFWGIFGTVPTRVQGMGVLIKTGGVYDVVPLSSGQITDISVRSGDQVSQGQVIARIDQPQLADEIKQARERLRELRERHTQIERFGSRNANLQDGLAAQQRATIEESVRSAAEQAGWLRDRVTSQTELLKEGLITEQALLQTKQQLQSTQERTKRLRSELKQLSIQTLSAQNESRQDMLASKMQISDLEREMQQLQDQYQNMTEVRSPYTGRILEITVQAGSIVREGNSIMRLDRIGSNIENLEAVLYVPGIDGKRVKHGMEVQISPATVKREEHGFMAASVTRVSDFPSTPEGMERTLKNKQLVQTFSKSGTPYEISASLRLDPGTVSGYEWSSSKGPDTQIQTGTICSATITIDERRPAEMVLPALRHLLGV